jgi:hypothetical protein
LMSTAPFPNPHPSIWYYTALCYEYMQIAFWVAGTLILDHFTKWSWHVYSMRPYAQAKRNWMWSILEWQKFLSGEINCFRAA